MRIKSMRLTIQVIFFCLSSIGVVGIAMTGLVYPYFFCPASPGAVANCPLLVLEHAMVEDVTATHTLAILAYLFGLIGFLGLVFGRAFCGWACPIGFVQEMLWYVQRFISEMLRPIKKVGEKALTASRKRGIQPRIYKYFILVTFVVLLSYLTGTLFFTNRCPVGGLTGTIPYLAIGGFDIGPYFAQKMVFTFAFILISLLACRTFCRYLCPVGALLSPMNKFSLLRMNTEWDNCTECMACRKVCPMEVPTPYDKRHMECILCGKCVDACKFDARDFCVLYKKIKKE